MGPGWGDQIRIDERISHASTNLSADEPASQVITPVCCMVQILFHTSVKIIMKKTSRFFLVMHSMTKGNNIPECPPN